MRVFTILSALLMSGLTVLACANLSAGRTGLDGKSVSGKGATFSIRDLEKALKKDLGRDGGLMEEDLRNSTDFNGRSDHAVALMYLGRSDEAVTRLTALEKERPGEYFVAANLGTAYELAGNNVEALKWIQECIRRNPESHEGTEWIHVRILEAKIQQEKDPTYFDHHTVLDLDPAALGSTMHLALGKPDESIVRRDFGQAILHQLKERIQFVKPPDAPVAGLLFDLAMLEAGGSSLEYAVEILNLAQAYGFPHTRLAPVLADFNRKIFWHKTRTKAAWVLAGAGAVLLLVVLYRKGIFVLSAKDLKHPKMI